MTILKFRVLSADTSGRVSVAVFGGDPDFTLQKAGELRLTVSEWDVLKDALLLASRISIEERLSVPPLDSEERSISDRGE